MKFLNVVVVALVIAILTSCGSFFGKGIKGNGNVIIENRMVAPFSEIQIDGVFNVILSQGNKESISIEADENLIDLVEISNANNRLVVDFKDNVSIRQSTKFNVFITFVDIDKLEVGGVGDLSVENSLHLKKLELECNGVGDVNLVLDCNNLIVENSSVGDISLSGSADYFDLSNSGVGDVMASSLISEVTVVDNSGVGDVEVNTTQSIEIESSGVGDVVYSGSPKTKSISDNAVGDVYSK